jgi:hypothetical protein
MPLNPRNALLPTEVDDGWALPPDLYSKGTARGTYNPMQFLVRIHPGLQESLSLVETGVHSSTQIPFATLSAFSTYLHETIHWWQHVGSISGLILSFCFPAQAHVNYGKLKQILAHIGPRKPLHRFHLRNAGSIPEEIEKLLNIVLNNWHDIEFCRQIMLSPQTIQKILKNKYFESVGHSYYIAWASCLQLLSQACDPNWEVLPDPRPWHEAFLDLDKRRVRGYYYGSPIYLAPLGARAIFEGQARFSQLQYLHFATGGNLNWDEFEKYGMLGDAYVEAFSLFLDGLQQDWPESIDHPLVALFLLLCDLSINPTEGLPFNVRFFDTFLLDIDPGTRFLRLVQSIRDKLPALKTAITAYSIQQYVEVSEILSAELICPSPLAAARQIVNWPKLTNGFSELLKEDAEFRFRPDNLPVRVFSARFIQFHKDKLEHPEFFVWPGVWSVGREGGELSLEESLVLFERNAALFVDAPNGEVRPQLIDGRLEKNVYDTFNQFYSWNASYSLIRQWHVQEGPFDLDFGWLSAKYSDGEMEAWAAQIFESSFGCHLSEFVVEV